MLMGVCDPKRIKDYLNLTKRNLRNIVGILTGHCKLNYQLKKLGISTNTACKSCEESDETSTRVQGQYPTFVKSTFMPDARLKHSKVGNMIKVFRL